jgi:cob(I)alamin adenosyltransferase
MVNLTRIYTRTGDQGTTALGDMSRVAKTDPRISAYADANEANAVIGTAIALGGLDEEVVAVLTRVQNDLFDVGADLSTPVAEDPKCTVVRRAERSTWAALEVHAEVMNPLTATYLNRLSDLLFILARTANKETGDVLWVPGGER